MAIDSYQAFIIQRRSDLRRIAAQTRGEHALEDVEAEAWLIAERIAAKRGFEVRFSLRTDQELVLAWLHNELVKYADKQLRFAVKLDKGWDQEDADGVVHSMASLLAAPESFDPAKRLALLEETPNAAQVTRHSYSQASAYVILLYRFDWDASDLAHHLCMVVATLRARLRWHAALMRRQPSLFGGVQTIALDFEPTRQKLKFHAASKQSEEALQLDWTLAAQSL